MKARLSYQNQNYTISENETVLDCLLREQVNVSHSCKSGACQSCLLQAVEGEIPEQAQTGLKATYRKQKLFLACQCYPKGDMALLNPDEAGLSIRATLVKKEPLNHNILRICLRPAEPLECEPGQYLTLINADRVARSYSVANHPERDGRIELHIRLIEGGLMSDWLRNDVLIGDEMIVRGPAGNCFYACEEENDYPVILAGTGTGLAPLYGIAHEALTKGHKGTIQLFHGALRVEDLYLIESLQALSDEHGNFVYTPCVLNGKENQFYQVGDIQMLVADAITDKAATRLFLCGAPEMVNPLKTRAFLAGLASQHIFADPFLPSKA